MSNFLYMLENTILWEEKKGKKKKEIYTSLGMAIFLMHFSPRVKFTVEYQKKKVPRKTSDQKPPRSTILTTYILSQQPLTCFIQRFTPTD